MLILHEVVAAVNLCDYVFIHNLIARQLQKVKSADGIVALAFRRFKPLLYMLSKFVAHKKVSLRGLPCKLTFYQILSKRRLSWMHRSLFPLYKELCGLLIH